MYYLLAFLLSVSIPFSSFHSSHRTADPVLSQTDTTGTLKMEDILRTQLQDSLVQLYNSLNLSDYSMSFEVFRYGMIGYNNLRLQGKLGSKSLLTIIDFTKPSTQKRFYTLDLSALRVKYYTYVSHGRNTGENEAKSFSNVVHSNQSSLGFYMTAETYIGSKGYSLKLDGLEKGYNDKVRERAVVIHEADYVSESWIKKYGRLGRSQGCPALPIGQSREIIDVIKNQTLIFAYFNDNVYLKHSSYLDVEQIVSALSATASIKKHQEAH